MSQITPVKVGHLSNHQFSVGNWSSLQVMPTPPYQRPVRLGHVIGCNRVNNSFKMKKEYADFESYSCVVILW